MPRPVRKLSWRPIKTAPRDGQYVLLLNRWHAVYVGFYNSSRPIGRRWQVEGFDDFYDDFFTSWTPIPARPGPNGTWQEDPVAGASTAPVLPSHIVAEKIRDKKNLKGAKPGRSKAGTHGE